MILGGRRRRWWPAILTILVVLAALLGYGCAETHWIDIKEYVFENADLPEEFDGTRIVFVADIHRGPFFSEDRVRSLAERVNALAPDLIVLGGDYVYKDTALAASCVAGLARLDAPLGVFAVLGNHDYGPYGDGSYGPAPVIEAFEQSSTTLLHNRGTWIERCGARLRIGGCSDYQQGTPLYSPTVQGTDPRDFVMLISHNPDFAEKLPADAVDLVLSGHTHGGQVTLFGLWAFHLPSEYGQKYRTGLVTNHNTTVIVSNGVGTSGILPIRLFARPQIVVITLRAMANLHPE